MKRDEPVHPDVPSDLTAAIRRQSLRRFVAHQIGITGRVSQATAALRNGLLMQELLGNPSPTDEPRPVIDGILREHGLTDGTNVLPLGDALLRAESAVLLSHLADAAKQGKDSERIVNWAVGTRWAPLGVDHTRTIRPEEGQRVLALTFAGALEARVHDTEAVYVASLNATISAQVITAWHARRPDRPPSRHPVERTEKQ